MYKLIIADDDPVIRESLRTRFDWREMGFEILAVCEDGRDVLELLERERADAVLTDIVMYEVSGLEVAKCVSERGLDTKVVLVSGYDEFEYAKKGIEYDVFGYLLKPVSYDELRQTFAKLRAALKRNAVLARLGGAEYGQSAQPAARRDEDVERVKAYALEHLKEPLTTSLLAEVVHQSARHLSRKFLSAEGRTLGKFLLDAKMERARTLLRENRLTVAEIGAETGFSDEKYFRKVFHDYFGYSVKEARS